MNLRYRLIITLISDGAHYPLCMNRMNVFGEKVIHCHKQPGFKYRHDIVKDVLYDVL